MSDLVMQSSPGFVDLDDSVIAADEVLTDDALVTISQNAKFGALRYERIFMGFYKHGDVIGTPISPVDGYSYSQEEVTYDWNLYHTHAPDAFFVSGQATPPGVVPFAPANILYQNYDIDDSTGTVLMVTTYYVPGTETDTNDGVMKVYANCQRSSVNIAN